MLSFYFFRVFSSRLRVKFLLLFFLSFCAVGVAQNNRVLLNSSFEQPELITLSFIDDKDVDGWLTTDNSKTIEFWVDEGKQDGRQYVELNSFSRAALYQDICMVQGETFQWSFWHKARAVGVDSMVLFIDGVEQDRFGSSNVAWENYTESYTLNSPSKIVRFQFEALSTASGDNTIGNFLDNITISGLKAFVYFDADSTSTLESVGNTPYLLLNGEVTTASQIDVEVSGGEATDGTDFTLTKTVNIPIGSYDGTINTGIAVRLSVIDDTDFESDEKVSLRLLNPTGTVTLNQACTPVPINIDYTIINDDCDDSNLEVVYPDSVCVGGDFDVVVDTEGENLFWTLMNDDSHSFSGTNNATASITASDQTISIKVIQDIMACPKDTVFDVFIFKEKTAIANATPSEVCEGDSVLITTQGLASFVWDNGLVPVDSQYISAVATTTYEVKGSFVDGCEGSASVSIVVNEKPVAGVGVVPDVCAGDQVNLMANSDIVNSSFLWIGEHADSLNDVTVPNPISASTKTISHKVEVKSPKGCLDTAIVKVVVNPLPNVTGATTKKSVCAGDQVVLTGNNALNYSWNQGVVNGQSFVPDVTKMYTVTGTDNKGCENTFELNVVVNNIHVPMVSIEYDGDICEGNEVVFTIRDSSNLGNAPTYVWYKNNIDKVGGGNELKLSNLKQGDEIKLEVTSNKVCVMPVDQIKLSNVLRPIIYSKPQLNLSTLIDLCRGDIGDLRVKDESNVAITFTFYNDRDQKVIENSTGIFSVDKNNKSQFYYVEANNSGFSSCKSRSNNGIVTYIEPFADLSVSENEIKKGEEVRVEAVTNVTDFEWSTNPLSFTNTSDVEVSDTPEHTNFYIFKGQLKGCFVSDSIEVRVVDPFTVPYLFTPNGDGNNDTWVLDGLGDYQTYVITIYNRWGNKVQHYESDFESWNGTGLSGQDLPDGVYYYVVETTIGREIEAISGYVTIIR